MASRQAAVVAAAVLAVASTTWAEMLLQPEHMPMDDECDSGASQDCALNALQFRASAKVGRKEDPLSKWEAREVELPEGWTSDVDYPETWDPSIAANAAGDEESVQEALSVTLDSAAQYASSCRYHSWRHNCYLYRACVYGNHSDNLTYCIYGNYMIVPAFPISGTEAINGGNSKDVDVLMHAAHNACNTSSCVLMVNPMHHRTQDQLHLHFRHYNGGGSYLKRHLESATCNSTEWVSFHKCRDGKARAYDSFPDVFTETALAYGNHSLRSMGITVFPAACGGNKTIVLSTGHCSIEHSISSR